MTPHEFADIVARPTVEEFLANRGDRRRAVLACISTYHIIDYLAADIAGPQPSKNRMQDARKHEAQNIRDHIRPVVGPSLEVVHGICNGTKHADFVPMRDVPALAFDVPGAGWDQGRWEVPGLEVESDGRKQFVDLCVQALFLALRANYGPQLDPLNLGFFDTVFRGVPGWVEPTE